MTEQWIRRYSLVMGGSGGKTLDLSDLRFRFSVKQAIVQTPGTAEIIITNPNEATSNAIQKEYDTVQLSAGYEGNMAVIFSGNVKQSFRGRENVTDTYQFLNCAGGDKAYNFATVSKTLAKGATPQDIVDVATRAMREHGVSVGQIVADLSVPRYPRAVVMFGMARDWLRQIAHSKDATWWIDNNEVHIVDRKKTLQGGDIVLSSTTGLIGMPVQTFSGIMARCLINPQIKRGAVVRIDQKSIQQAKIDLGVGGDLPPQAGQFPSIATDGRYKVLGVDITGDTRGQAWYMDLTCESVSSPGIFDPGTIQLRDNPYLGTQ